MKAQDTNAIDFTNKFLNSTAAVKSVAESIKRLAYTVSDAIIVNNSLKPKDSIILIDSLQNHYSTIQVLDLSRNVIGPLGGSNLVQKLPQMKDLRNLKLAGCQITDRGLIPMFDIMTA
jgi:Ran GTPase-activating protein (RanGAP) involved in mRNA processing and transport